MYQLLQRMRRPLATRMRLEREACPAWAPRVYAVLLLLMDACDTLSGRR